MCACIIYVHTYLHKQVHIDVMDEWMDSFMCVRPFQISLSDFRLLVIAFQSTLVQMFIMQERSLMVRWVVGSILHGVDPLSYFSFQPVLHDLCNKGCGMYYPVCGMVHIKEPLLLNEKSSPCGSSGFPLSLSEWSFAICPSALLNKTFPSFLYHAGSREQDIALW